MSKSGLRDARTRSYFPEKEVMLMMDRFSDLLGRFLYSEVLEIRFLAYWNMILTPDGCYLRPNGFLPVDLDPMTYGIRIRCLLISNNVLTERPY